MSKLIREIEIEAPAERVWEVLADFSSVANLRCSWSAWMASARQSIRSISDCREHSRAGVITYVNAEVQLGSETRRR